jgi:hypothetical protein
VSSEKPEVEYPSHVVRIESIPFLNGKETGMNRTGVAVGVFCLILASALALALLIELVISIFSGHFLPWWFWLLGLLGVGVLGIVAGSLLALNRTDQD